MGLNNPKWLHIIPEDDIYPHIENASCPCVPRLDWDNWTITHNSFDGREVFEEIQEYYEHEDKLKGELTE